MPVGISLMPCCRAAASRTASPPPGGNVVRTAVDAKATSSPRNRRAVRVTGGELAVLVGTSVLDLGVRFVGLVAHEEGDLIGDGEHVAAGHLGGGVGRRRQPCRDLSSRRSRSRAGCNRSRRCRGSAGCAPGAPPTGRRRIRSPSAVSSARGGELRASSTAIPVSTTTPSTVLRNATVRSSASPSPDASAPSRASSRATADDARSCGEAVQRPAGAGREVEAADRDRRGRRDPRAGQAQAHDREREVDGARDPVRPPG